MTYEQWVEATKRGISLGDEAEESAADDAAPSIDATAYDAFNGEAEEEDTPKPDAIENAVPPPSPGPRGLFKKPLGQPSLSK